MTPATDSAREGADLRERLAIPDSLRAILADDVEALSVSLTEACLSDGVLRGFQGPWEEFGRVAEPLLLDALGSARRDGAAVAQAKIDRLTAALDKMRAERDEALASDAESVAMYRRARDRADVLRQRVEAALTEACRPSAILLMAGEMTAQERRTAHAVANGLAAKVQAALDGAPISSNLDVALKRAVKAWANHFHLPITRTASADLRARVHAELATLSRSPADAG